MRKSQVATLIPPNTNKPNIELEVRGGELLVTKDGQIECTLEVLDGIHVVIKANSKGTEVGNFLWDVPGTREVFDLLEIIQDTAAPNERG